MDPAAGGTSGQAAETAAALCRGGLTSTERDEDGKMAGGESSRHSCSTNVIRPGPIIQVWAPSRESLLAGSSSTH